MQRVRAWAVPLVASLMAALLILRASVAAASTPETPEADRLFAFAGSLMEEEDYYRAITEYKRFISYFPQDGRVPLCRLNMGLAYSKGNRADLAVEHFREIRQDYPGAPVAEKASFEIGAAYFESQRFDDAREAFSEFIHQFPDSARLDAARIFQGWALIHLWRMEEASSVLASIGDTSAYHAVAQGLAGEVRLNAGDVPARSPVLAGLLSGVLPGAGQFYAGRATEGLTSFVLNGSFLWATIELFHHGNEIAGLLFAFFETGWYTGGIFGAVNDVHKFNRKAKDDYIGALRNRYPLPAYD